MAWFGRHLKYRLVPTLLLWGTLFQDLKPSNYGGKPRYAQFFVHTWNTKAISFLERVLQNTLIFGSFRTFLISWRMVGPG